MKKLIPLLLITLSACGDSKKFEDVKVGMSTKKVVELVGEPETKQPIFTGEWWFYTKQNKLVIVSADTVVTVKQDLKASQDSMKTVTEDMKNMLDSVGK